jgi:hypothetical protein
VLRTDHNLTPLSANFWALVFHVDPQDVAALGGNRPYTSGLLADA